MIPGYNGLMISQNIYVGGMLHSQGKVKFSIINKLFHDPVLY